METAPGTRHVDCDGAFNIRDLGGYPTADGATTRWRTIYRADGLHRVDDEAADRLRELGWQTVIDLRTADELELGAFRSDAAEVVHLPVLQDIWDPELVDAATEPAAFLVERYLEMLDVGAGALSAAIEILAAPERRPAVFHCAAGKDRTGVLAAMVLSLVGVPDDVIATDYALSAVAMDRMLDWYRANRPDVIDRMAQQPAAFMACPEEAMHGFLAEVGARHGSVERYLLDVGTDAGAIAGLRAQLIER